ncbi:MAG: hypothetical protein LBR55_03465 [Bacteroidales bacterium]|jgi:hypothetical protein|nr:hypothetical protein [Bacteroidales bacterium]
MKKINSIILAACVAALGFFSSCNKDEANDPSVNLLNTNGVISAEVGEEVTFGYKVEKGSADIQQFTVVLAQSGVELTQELIKIDATTTTSPKLSDLNKAGGYTFDFARTFNTAGTYTITITAQDKDGGEGSKKATITVGDASGAIDWTTASNKIIANGTYLYQQGTKEGVIVVSDLTTTAVTVKLDDFASVALSDAGASWLMNDGTAKQQADATSQANTPNIVCAKLSGQATIGSWELTQPGQAAPNAVKFIKFVQE